MDESTVNARKALEAQLIDRAMKDAAFREELVRDPKAVFARELGISVPEASMSRCWRKARPPCISCCHKHQQATAPSYLIKSLRQWRAAGRPPPPSVAPVTPTAARAVLATLVPCGVPENVNSCGTDLGQLWERR